MNKELLLKVKEKILAEPKTFNMVFFAVLVDEHIPECGTTACIAGWACLIADPEAVTPDWDDEDNSYCFYTYPFASRASELLQLTDDQTLLFYDDEWPEPFRSNIAKYIEGTPEYAKAAADFIDYFIEKDGNVHDS